MKFSKIAIYMYPYLIMYCLIMQVRPIFEHKNWSMNMQILCTCKINASINSYAYDIHYPFHRMHRTSHVSSWDPGPMTS